MPNTKRCRICREAKALEEFSIDRSRRDGLVNCCKHCDNERKNGHRADAQQTCQRCGIVFYGRKRKYCKRDCGRTKRAPSKPKQACEICGEPYRARIAHGIEQRTCSRACDVILRCREGKDREPRGASVPIPWAECRLCHRQFVARHGHLRCDECRATPVDYYRLGRRELFLKPLVEQECRECGKRFMPTRPHHGTHRTIYCSDLCSRRMGSRNRRYRKRTNGPQDSISLSKLAARDGWRCHICGRKVTPQTWTMDHLDPISRGGAHTWANVALAHRLCNSKRGAGRIPAQLRLVG